MSKNRKILNNTLALYIRLLITVVLNLYVTRILLKNLGIEDFGLYGAIAGVIALISFFQAALSNATNRFLNMEVGKGDIPHIQKIFSTAFFLHIFIALIFCILIEIFGTFILSSFVKLPAEKINISMQVFHLSIISLFILVITIPFESILMAKEKFGIYALISILDVTLKLLLAYILMFFTHDKLLYYASGFVCIVFLTRLTYVIYSQLNIIEARIKFYIDNDFLKKIINFIGWELYLNFCVVFKVEGIMLLMNNFFGLIAVASIKISYQINAALYSLSSNLSVAVKPQLMRSYADYDVDRMNMLTFYSAKYSYYFMLIFCAPIIFNIDYILKFWLGSPPAYTKVITIFVLISSLIEVLFYPIVMLIHATGNLKKFSILTGTLILSSVPLVYLLFKFGLNYYYAYIIYIINTALASFLNLWIVKKLITDFDLSKFLRKVLVNIMITTVTIILALKVIAEFVVLTGFVGFLTVFVLETLVVISLIYGLGVEKTHKDLIKIYLKSKIK
ncbi:lipopolysaccharide biosynthesis protein [Acinetobacter tandoii]|uniref:lipopolysaccharide biosynthesis protein n=1 Tax=Acinetobacter tandoii TaxID=202954 RepID=UPI00301A60A4